ncbi:hypothetical protein ANCDUO_02406 [Ancylostoma duodenale]|uniref:Uncharacterized protein n=1 Tax=Ancylostoma duodenale TaxID=51022 RepID=A0A0C2DWF4_9BILA|nr:hypothetical protein ANCDUO_02406 [Ancylostoma duodenale]
MGEDSTEILAKGCPEKRNERYSELIRGAHDKKNKVKAQKLRKGGDKVPLKSPREKANPYRVTETGIGIPFEHLNEINNGAVKFAKINSWEGLASTTDQIKVVVLLPDPFCNVNTENVERLIYRSIVEIGSVLGTTDAQKCILVGPTTNVTPPKKDWCKLSSSLDNAARNGVLIVTVAPPRGDSAYFQKRPEMNGSIEIARNAAAPTKQNIVSPSYRWSRREQHLTWRTTKEIWVRTLFQGRRKTVL